MIVSDTGIALLGNTAKSAAVSALPPEVRGRLRRYEIRSNARVPLQRFYQDSCLSEAGKYPGDVFRTIDCGWKMHGSHVAVRESNQYQTCHYGGLTTCGSVWACPVCAAVIQERRRGEIEQAMAWAARRALQAVMVTFTFPHYADHDLRLLLEQQAQAYGFLRRHWSYRKLHKLIGYQGMIRSLEITYGDRNGYHPHTHELWFIRMGEGNAFMVQLLQLWERACIEAGLLDPGNAHQVHAFRLHALDVKVNVDSGEYLAKQDDSRKWDFSHELAKATSKAGRLKGFHPFHFLVRNGPRDSSRYVDFVVSTKGKRQLSWSPGLKDRVGVDEIPDEILADESRDAATVLGLLDSHQWKVIRGNAVEGYLLDAAEQGGWPAVLELLHGLTGPH